MTLGRERDSKSGNTNQENNALPWDGEHESLS